MAVVFVGIGRDMHIEGGFLEDAINEGVKDGYVGGHPRKSAVNDPIFERKNMANNAPPS